MKGVAVAVHAGGTMEYLSSARALLAVPGMAGASVKASQFMQELEDVGRLDESVIVVWQYAPGDSASGVLSEEIEQGAGESIHAPRRVSNMVRVFVAGGGDEKMEVAVVGAVRRRMPRTGVFLAPREDFLALCGRELTPEVTRRGHMSSGTESRLQPEGLSHDWTF